MKRIIEKFVAIYYIITNSEYAIYTTTDKSDKRRSNCIVSDNASSLFLNNIITFTGKIIKMRQNGKI